MRGKKIGIVNLGDPGSIHLVSMNEVCTNTNQLNTKHFLLVIVEI